MSCSFMSCYLVRHFHVQHFQLPRPGILFQNTQRLGRVLGQKSWPSSISGWHCCRVESLQVQPLQSRFSCLLSGCLIPITWYIVMTHFSQGPKLSMQTLELNTCMTQPAVIKSGIVHFGLFERSRMQPMRRLHRANIQSAVWRGDSCIVVGNRKMCLENRQ